MDCFSGTNGLAPFIFFWKKKTENLLVVSLLNILFTTVLQWYIKCQLLATCFDKYINMVTCLEETFQLFF